MGLIQGAHVYVFSPAVGCCFSHVLCLIGSGGGSACACSARPLWLRTERKGDRRLGQCHRCVVSRTLRPSMFPSMPSPFLPSRSYRPCVISSVSTSSVVLPVRHLPFGRHRSSSASSVLAVLLPSISPFGGGGVSTWIYVVGMERGGRGAEEDKRLRRWPTNNTG